MQTTNLSNISAFAEDLSKSILLKLHHRIDGGLGKGSKQIGDGKPAPFAVRLETRLIVEDQWYQEEHVTTIPLEDLVACDLLVDGSEAVRWCWDADGKLVRISG